MPSILCESARESRLVLARLLPDCGMPKATAVRSSIQSLTPSGPEPLRAADSSAREAPSGVNGVARARMAPSAVTTVAPPMSSARRRAEGRG